MAMYRFVVRGGKTVEQGKVNYPDYVLIELNRREAFDILAQLANALRDQEQHEIGLDLSGQIESYKED